MGINRRLREAIELKGLSLTEAAERAAIPYRTLQNYVSGQREPNSKALTHFNERLGISLDWLLTGVGQMYRDQPATEIVTATGLPPRQQALLDLFNALPEDKQREILGAIEDKKRIVELEEQYRELKTALDSLKSTG